MKIARLKNSVTYLLLILFISMKMAGLHALAHADDSSDHDHAIHCLICDQALVNNFIPVLASDIQDFCIENTEAIIQQEISDNYSAVVSRTISKDQLICRPPPFLS